MNESTQTSCSSARCCAETKPKSACSGPAQSLIEAGSQCPIEGATALWAQSFGEAMRQAQIEILKDKILKSHGPMMDQAAQALMETMGALWAEKIAEVRLAEAKASFQNRLRDLWLQKP